MADLDAAIANAKEAGIYVILTPIDASQNLTTHFPTWVTGASPAPTDTVDAINRFSTGYINALATRYADEPQVVALDLVSEPRTSSIDNTRVLQMYQAMIQTVRAADSDKIVQLEPTYGNTSFAAVCADWSVITDKTNVEIQVHDAFAGGDDDGFSGCASAGIWMWTGSDYTTAAFADMNNHALAYIAQAKAAGVAVMVGEYEEAGGVAGHDAWLNDKVPVFNANGLSRIWWELHTSNPDSATDSSWNFYPWVPLLTSAATSLPVPPPPPPTGPCGTTLAAPTYQHVVWIVFENKQYGEVIGDTADAPFVNSLANQCGNATNMFAEAHPSLPNYVAMTSGGTQSIADDLDPSSHPLDVPSIFSQVGDGWRSLEESMPSNCFKTNSGNYAVRHNPAAYYTNLTNCSSQDVPLGVTPDLSAAFTFVTPNLCNDMHTCPTQSTTAAELQSGDAFLSNFMAKVYETPEWQAGNTVVFVTWDEVDSGTANHIPTLVVAPSVVPGTKSVATFNHYSMLRTTEELLGLPFIGGASTASSMAPEFNLSAASTRTFVPTADTYVQADTPTTTYGPSTQIIADNSPIKHLLLKFNVSGLNGRTVTSAKLRLYCVDPSNFGGDFYAVPDTTWNEATVNWNTAPAASSTSLGTLGSVVSGLWYEVDVTPLITGDGVVAFEATSTSGDGAQYSSKEGVNPPQLALTIQ
jgi:phosphatidylinositol-3-phosphatase